MVVVKRYFVSQCSITSSKYQNIYRNLLSIHILSSIYRCNLQHNMAESVCLVWNIDQPTSIDHIIVCQSISCLPSARHVHVVPFQSALKCIVLKDDDYCTVSGDSRSILMGSTSFPDATWWLLVCTTTPECQNSNVNELKCPLTVVPW